MDSLLAASSSEYNSLETRPYESMHHFYPLTLSVQSRETPTMTDDIDIPTEPQAAVDALANHLIATAERPVPPATNRWLGEAEAVARDATSDDLDSPTRQKRVRQVATLLESADKTDDAVADRHIEAAIECCRVVLANE